MLNVKKLLTKLLEKTIVENSTNNYITIGNFAMCWGYKDIPNIAASGYTYIEPTFPITFSSEPLVVPYVAGGFGSGRVMQLIASHGMQSTTKAKILLYNYAGGAINTASNGLGYVAIGFIGGYSIVSSLLSRLAERWWEYAESKETQHQDIRESSASGYILKIGNATCKRTKCDIHRHKHTKWSNCQGGLSDKNTERKLGGQWNHYIQQYNSGSSLPQYGKFGNKRVIRSSGILHDIAISERGWSCA